MADQSPLKPLGHQAEHYGAPLSTRGLGYVVGDNSELNPVQLTESATDMDVLTGDVRFKI
jgi:hypothetical protein